MSFRVSIEPRAAQEIEAAYAWYERAIYRRIHLTKFPYALHYTIQGSQVLVLACLHARQDPTLWPGA